MNQITPPASVSVTGLFIGKAMHRWPGRAASAIGKSRTMETLALGPHGFEKDQQADLAVHGGADKALHHYAADHYASWAAEKPELVQKFVPGGFGENISATGFTEENLCIGDILTLGSATIQISQGRQPCWKLNAHMEDETMANRFQKTGLTGWYYRVLEPGHVATGDTLKLMERPCPAWPLSRAIAARFDPRLPIDVAAELAALPQLAANWREAFAKKSQRGFSENTDARLRGG